MHKLADKTHFKVKTRNVAKPLCTMLGALIIQTKFQYSDRELVEQITENLYLQYFIRLPGYQKEPLFNAGTLVVFHKRINTQMIVEMNGNGPRVNVLLPSYIYIPQLFSPIFVKIAH